MVRSYPTELTPVYAKTSPHVLDPPAFALHLGLHFVHKYAHIHKAFIDIISLRWSRIPVSI
jgi:urate oxidase